MEQFDSRQLPFLSRDMLAFGKQTTFSLIADVVANFTNEIEIRGYTIDGFFTYKIRPTLSSALQTFTFQIPDVPIAISVFMVPGIGNNLSQYVTLHLGANENRIALLCQGQISPVYGISWPNQHPLMRDQAGGEIVEYTGLNPAAGAEVADEVPPLEVWEILAIKFTLVTNATVADRTVAIRLTTGEGSLLRRISTVTQQASETQTYHFIPGGTTGVITADTEQEIALPAGIILPGESSIASVTTNLQSADNFGAATYLVRRYFSPNSRPTLITP